MIWWIVFAAIMIAHTVGLRFFVPAMTLRRYDACPKDLTAIAANCLFHLIWIVALIQCNTDATTLPDWVRGLGAGLAIGGHVLSIAAFRENPFFVPITARPPRIIATGVYRLRHPGYAGMATAALGSFFLLAQDLAVIPLTIYIVILLRRTYVEHSLL